jgi:hypothetical protein
MNAFPIILALLCAVPAGGAVPPRLDGATPKAQAAGVCEWHKEAKGFAATVIITPDPEWKLKWSAPAMEVPAVEQTDAVRVGGKVWAMVFLSNPQPDQTGKVDVTCDFRLVRPNGQISTHRDLRALHGTMTAPTSCTFLSEFVLTMDAEPTDPLGEWVMELVVRDRNRGVEVPIVGRYRVLPNSARR